MIKFLCRPIVRLIAALIWLIAPIVIIMIMSGHGRVLFLITAPVVWLGVFMWLIHKPLTHGLD